jgi:putative nucleotidyltransferase with HDIG domain
MGMPIGTRPSPEAFQAAPDAVQAAIDRADELGVFPAAALRAREIASDATSSAADLERALGLDPILASRVLRVAKSPFYGNGRVSSLREAILRIGFNTARDLATALSFANLSNHPNTRQHKLWSHSVRVGLAARRLSRWVGCPSDPMFIAGLMHDVGHLVMLLADIDGYDALLGKGSHIADFTKFEHENYQFDHAQVASRLLARWNFEPSTVRAVMHHHDPVQGGDREAWVLAACDRIALLHEAKAPKAAIHKVLVDTGIEAALHLEGRILPMLEDFDGDVAEFERLSDAS